MAYGPKGGKGVGAVLFDEIESGSNGVPVTVWQVDYDIFMVRV